MPLRQTRGIQSLREALAAMDADLRKTRCPVCGKPTGGVVFAGQTGDEAGICTRADHVSAAPAIGQEGEPSVLHTDEA